MTSFHLVWPEIVTYLEYSTHSSRPKETISLDFPLNIWAISFGKNLSWIMFYLSPLKLSLKMFYSCLHLSKVGHFPFFSKVWQQIESEIMFVSPPLDVSERFISFSKKKQKCRRVGIRSKKEKKKLKLLQNFPWPLRNSNTFLCTYICKASTGFTSCGASLSVQ